jgi:hypothetical protein
MWAGQNLASFVNHCGDFVHYTYTPPPSVIFNITVQTFYDLLLICGHIFTYSHHKSYLRSCSNGDSLYSRNDSPFIEPEGSLPCLQEPALGSCPVHTLILFLEPIY